MPRITLSRELEARAERITERNLLVEARYRIATPAMIGDFTGDTYKIIEAEGGMGAALTGLPSAQAIIGKARWLARVAIATATGARTHREAEKAAPVTVRLPGGRWRSLGVVELLFGSSRKRWRGLLSVEAKPLPRKGGKLYVLEPGGGELDLLAVIVRARSVYSSDYFYMVDETWRPGKKGNYIAAPRKPWGSNRYNSLLAVGAYTTALGGEYTFFPADKQEGRLKLIDPLSHESVLEGFTLRISVDEARLKLVAESDKNRARAALRLGILSLLAAPVLLGLGKASNRGFGRFTLEKGSSKSASNYGDLLDVVASGDPREIIGRLYELAREASGASGEPPLDWEDSLIPLLPAGDLASRFIEKVNVGPRAERVEQVLDLIGFAATKYSWKSVALGTTHPKRVSHELGDKYHTWPLGLPRRGKFKGMPTGYLLEDGGEGRRQSFVTAYTLDGETVHVVGFPSGDLVKLHGELVFHRVIDQEHFDIPVSKIPRCVWIEGWGRRQVRDCDVADKIEAAFWNFVRVLEVYKPRQG